ncbi:MAG TPA: SDR family NAD(P)-dependent oxidoreductase [Anaeromyxobacteraceae bacterium]|nr:SDR family NAD(P)-dependent oxidoreductase [Anaeromyxobacteraceae bacterium]
MESAILRGRVALVTGASSGIGEATARALAAAGARVAAVARRRERLETLAGASGGAIAAEAGDVSTQAGASGAVAFAVRTFGRLDLLVSNAGVMLLGPVEEAKPDELRRMVELNLLGVMYASQAALPHLVAARGDLVVVSSVAAKAARGGFAGYGASKFGVSAYAEALRQEMSPRGVRVITVVPGLVTTELAGHVTHAPSRRAIEERMAALTPLRPEDVAEAVLWAVSRPPQVAVGEIVIRPTGQPFP